MTSSTIIELKSRSTKPCVFPCKVAAAGSGRWKVPRVCCGWGYDRFGAFLFPRCCCGFKLLYLRLCVRSYRVIWNLGLQIAMEWQHACCHVVLPCASRDAGLQPGVAKRIGMSAWMLHGLRFGRKSLGLAVQGGRTQVMFVDGNSATHSHTARTHGRGWRTAHASSIDVKSLIHP